jgi:hypothetical protein
MRRLAGIAVLLLLICGAALAQDDGDLNACFAGGSMEGKCALDADGDGVLEQHEADWAWECGWYVGQLAADLIEPNQIPDWCVSVVPSPFRCFYYGADIPYSVLYIGPANTIGNASFYFSPDCTGDGTRFPASAMIIAGSLEEATAICESLGTDTLVDSLASFGYLNAAPNYYGCDVFGTLAGGPARFNDAGSWLR